MMEVINLTPHEVKIAPNGKDVTVILASKGIARVSELAEERDLIPTSNNGNNVGIAPGPLIPIFRINFGEVVGLPEPRDNTIYVVSMMVKYAFPLRNDLYSPYGLIRDAAGQPMACKGLC